MSEENNETLQCIGEYSTTLVVSFIYLFLIITDIDECRTGRAQCDNNSVCENTNGGYNCKCNHGYTKMNGHCLGKEEREV